MSGPIFADRVKETTTTTGTGTITLAGAATGYQSFAVVGDGNTCYYCIAGGAEWEVGIGTYTASGTMLSRNTVLASSNSGSLVSFSAGSKDVFVDVPASIIQIQRGGLVVPNAASFSSIGTGITLTDKNDRLQISCTVNSTQQLRGGTLASIAAPYTIDIAGGILGLPALNDALWFGIVLSDGTKYRAWYGGATNFSTNESASRCVVDSWSTGTSYSSTIATIPAAFNAGDFYARLTDDGATRKFWLSQNGKDFVLFYSEATNTYLTPTKFGFATYCVNTSVALKAYIKHWLVTSGVLGDAA